MKRSQHSEAPGATPDLASARNPVGRLVLLVRLFSRAWPLLRPFGWIYRRTVLRRVRVVAVVGTFGKTTTTRAIKTALGERVDGEARRAVDSWLVYELLRVRPGQRVVVIEIGIGWPGQMRPMARMLRPDITVVTSIGREHIVSMKRLEVTRAEKSEMVAATAPDGLVLLNGDDENVVWMARRSRARTKTFGRNPGCDVRIESSRLEWPHGTRVDVECDGERASTRPGVIGDHWAPVVAGAVAVGRALDVPLETLARRLDSLEPTVGRLQPVALPSGAHVLRDDEKAGRETLDVAMEVLGQIEARRRIVVMGEIAEPEKPVHPFRVSAGECIGRAASDLVLIGPRKASKSLSSGARRAGMDPERIHFVHHDLEKALHALPADLGPGDVVLVKGVHHQRLGRIAHALEGRPVRCFIRRCPINLSCQLCPMLERGWDEADD